MPRDMVSVRRPPTNRFAQEPQVRIGRSQFDRSHGLKTTFDASYLYPILIDEVLPGDTFTCSLNGFCRIFSPLDAPIMDNIELETFFFFVPTRLVWENWAYFNGEHDDKGYQDTDYTIPILSGATAVDHDAVMTGAARSMAAFGLPDGLIPNDVDVSALPLRSYNLIYNEWFRDQNLIDEIFFSNENGPDTASNTNYALRRSAKKHDYFTSCLPYLQKEAAADAPSLFSAGTINVETLAVQGNEVTIESGSGQRDLDSAGANVIVDSANTGSEMFVDLSSIDVTINTLRESVAIQRLLERDARGGTRYVELIKSHFGVTSPDFRLQRPEFLGGGKSFINVSAVANTTSQKSADSTAASGDVEQGELRGVGTGVISGHGWAKSFTEHGYVVGIIRARGDVTYWQGLDRMWSRSTRYDFYIPALAMLGEQSILNKELYVQNIAADDNVFGYQERWAEYRYKASRISGAFNPDTTTPLSFWHLAEDFGSLPTLAQTFIEDQTPMARVVTVTTQEDFLLDLWFNYKCARPIPVHSIPSLMGQNF